MNIIRNLFSVFSAELIGKAAGFVTLIYLARILQPESFGILNFAAASAGYFMLPVNFGFNDYGVLKVSPDRSGENIQRRLSNLLGLRFAIAIVSFGVLLAVSFVIPQFHQIQYLFIIFGLLAFACAFSTDWLFTAIERMEFIAIARIIGSLVYLGLIFLFVKSAEDLIPCGWITMGRQFAVIFLMLFIFSWKVGRLTFGINGREWRDILSFVLPIGFSSVAAQMNSNVDIVIVGFLRSSEEVGYYSAALRLISIGVGFKLLIGQIIYPKLVRYSVTSRKTLKKAAFLIQKYCIILGLLFGVVGAVLGEMIINFIYGIKFSSSIAPFQIAVWVVAIEFIGMVFPYIVLTVDRKLYAKIIISAVIVNMVMNLVLIPILGIIGAAISYLFSSSYRMVICYFYLNKKVISLPIGRLFLKPLLASFVMVLGILILQEMDFIIILVCGIVLYWVMIAAQGITPAKLRMDLRSMTSIEGVK